MWIENEVMIGLGNILGKFFSLSKSEILFFLTFF